MAPRRLPDAWIALAPTAVLETIVEWWNEGLVAVVEHDFATRVYTDYDFHPQPCDGSTHAQNWTGAVCAELTRRRAL